MTLAFLKASGDSFRIRIESNAENGYSVWLENDLLVILKDYLNVLKNVNNSYFIQRIKICENEEQVLEEIQAILNRISRSPIKEERLNSKFYSSVLGVVEEYEAISGEKVFNNSNDFSLFSIEIMEDERKHFVSFSFPPSFPKTFPTTSSDSLPYHLDVSFTPNSNLITIIKEAYRKEIKNFAFVYNDLEMIDKEAFVLDSTNKFHRRFAISNEGISLSVEWKSFGMEPILKVFGNITNQLTKRLKDNWILTKTTVDNVKDIFDIKSLPARQKDDVDVQKSCCGICYSFSGVEESPDEFCHNCSQIFHKSCLLAWANSLPITKKSFNTLFTNCPYCEKKLTIKVY
jgi:E3 ubiquitin-protein ligase FANCL